MELQDHHIFPRAFLKRHEIDKRVDVNSVANRTLISDETNGRIKDKAPAQYLRDGDLLSAADAATLLRPHFIDDATLTVLLKAREADSADDIRDLYARFVDHREALIVDEIRTVCGVAASASVGPDQADEPDEPAADVIEDVAPSSLAFVVDE